jgi:molybdenum cofactor biosynthesis enzyme MoaA
MKINLFNQEIKVKDYDCSYNKNIFNPRPPTFNLYIQITDACNAKCEFCDKPGCKDNDFDYDKFKYIFKELHNKNLIRFVSITGGEPFLNIEKLNKVIDIIHNINPNFPIGVNTNGYNLNAIKDLNITELHISRHHYNDIENQNVFKVTTPTLEEIKSTIKQLNTEVVFNCVLQKGLIDNVNDVKKYLDIVSLTGANRVQFISMMPLTKYYNENYVDPTLIIKGLSDTINDGYLYDKDICECFNLMYISSQGIPIEVSIKNNKQHLCSYTRQFVYTANNNLITGFGGQKII